MAGTLVPLVMFPRYSGFSWDDHSVVLSTVPIDVSDYQSAILTVWRGPVRSGVTFGISLEESTDQNTWTECDATQSQPYDPGSGDQGVQVATLAKRWLRASIQLGGAASTHEATCWAIGHLERRQK